MSQCCGDNRICCAQKYNSSSHVYSLFPPEEEFQSRMVLFSNQCTESVKQKICLAVFLHAVTVYGVIRNTEKRKTIGE